MQGSQFYIEVDRAQTPRGRKCNGCMTIIPQGDKYLHMNRNAHLFVLCEECLILFATKVSKYNSFRKSIEG